MRRSSATATAIAMIVASSLAGLGCQHDDREVRRELAAIRGELLAMRGQLGRGSAPVSAAPARPRPDPTKVYAVEVAGAPAVGAASAPVTLVIAYEYACGWCNKQQGSFAELRQAYGDDLRIVYRPFVVHDEAGAASLAACAAERQGKFSPVNDALWTDVFGKRAFDRATVDRAVTGVPGIDAARLQRDMDGDCKSWLDRERASLVQLGVRGTPQLWINGRPVAPGYQPLTTLKTVIDEELGRARERIAAGTPRDRYYREWVVDKGLSKL